MTEADLRDRTVYRLARDVPNPNPDRRSRRGRHIRTCVTWPAGLLVYALHDTWTARPKVYWRLDGEGLYDDLTATHAGYQAFLAALEPVRTLDSLLFGARKGLGSITPEEVLEHLLATSRIDLDTIAGAIGQLETREAAERAAEMARREAAKEP